MLWIRAAAVCQGKLTFCIILWLSNSGSVYYIANMGNISNFRLAREGLVACAAKDIVASSTAGSESLKNLKSLKPFEPEYSWNQDVKV